MAEPDQASPASVARAFLRAPFTRRTWAELTYVVVAAPVVAAGFFALLGLLIVSVMFSILVVGVVVGVPLVAVTLLGARYLGGLVHRALASALLDEQVPEPPPRPLPSRGLWSLLGWSFGDLTAWKAVAFQIVSFPVMGAAFFAAVFGYALGVVFVSYPFWWSLFDPTNVDASGRVRRSGMQFGDFYVDTWPRALAFAALGVLIMFVMPWVTRGFVWVQRLLVRSLLGQGRMSERVRALEETRSLAVDDSAAALRRIERDLHDGTQARLIALAMQLDMAREEMDDESRVRELVDTAHRNATDAITELRQVTRSIHPPILDRGLDAALATLAAGSAVPTLLSADIRARPSAAIETIAYFCVAELLANVAKHSHANRATVMVASQDSQEGNQLRVQVGDDGVGGAEISDTGGLSGLVDRLRTVDGKLRIDSPPGGPTLVTVDLPANA